METIDDRPLLSGKNRVIPGAESLALAFGIIAARGFAEPSLLQKFGAKFPDRGALVNFNVTQKAEALADGTGRAEFAGRQGHMVCARAGGSESCRNYILPLRASARLAAL